jgi:flagella synthesis protein FlgN
MKPPHTRRAAPSPAPAQPQALVQLLRGVGEDLRDYGVLLDLLDRQFDAALRHETTALAELSDSVASLVDVLNGRREERVALVSALCGAGAPMAAAFPLLASPHRGTLESGWRALEDVVRDCKTRNARNCRLLMDQQSIMQRVLHGEQPIYAPA